MTLTKNKLNVLFISHSSELYGAERSLLEIVTGLQNTNINTLLLVPSLGPLTKILNEQGMQYIVSPYMGWLGRENILLKGTFRVLVNSYVYITLLNKLNSLSLDLIYTNTSLSPIGGMLALGLGIPHIWHIRELVLELKNKYDFGEKLSMKFINKSTQKVVCNSYALYKDLSRHIALDKLCVVYNGVIKSEDQQKYSKKKLEASEKIKLCIVSSLCSNKNQLHAILALNVLIECGIDATLKIVGEGEKSYLNKLKETTQKLGIESRVFFEGFIENTLEVFRSSDISLICSQSETFGRVAVESMSVGTPVIATNVGGLPEIIEDEVNGLLYQSGDYRMLATKIMKLLQHPNLYESISEYGISSAYARFTREKCIANIKTIIQEVVIK